MKLKDKSLYPAQELEHSLAKKSNIIRSNSTYL